mgnify:CR=1 FL=1
MGPQGFQPIGPEINSFRGLAFGQIKSCTLNSENFPSLTKNSRVKSQSDFVSYNTPNDPTGVSKRLSPGDMPNLIPQGILK